MKAFVFRSALLMALALFGLAAGQTPLPTDAEAEALAESVMKTVVAGDYQAALASLQPHSLLPESEMNELAATTVSQRSSLAGRLGSSLGYELVATQSFGDSLLELTYIERTERVPLRWRFRFYNPGDGWLLYGLHWDDNVGALFGE